MVNLTEREQMKHLFIIALVFIAFGCESDEETPLEAPLYDITGNWSGTLTGATETTAFSASITQNGNELYGTMVTNSFFTYNVSGKIWADTLEIVCTDINNPTYKLTISGETNGIYVSGDWLDNASQFGIWEANKY